MSHSEICPEGEKSFRTHQNLRNHRKSHIDERPYFCSDCEKHVSGNNILKKHIRKIHAEVRRFECESCGKLFKRTSNLKYHKLFHGAEKHFPCMHCGKTFSQSSNRDNENMKTHNKEATFS